jgi:hypothetical protein
MLATLMTTGAVDLGSAGPVTATTATTGLAAFEAQLRAAGVPVVASFKGAAPRWEFTQFQAEVMAAQVAGHQGLVGAALDSQVPTPHGAPPVSYLVAAWAVGAHTPRSKLAARWMGQQDWHHAPQVLYPSAVLALFSLDMAEHLAADAAKAGGPRSGAVPSSTNGRHASLARPPAAQADATSGPCSAVDGFFSDAIVMLFNALHLSPSFLGSGGPLSVVGSFVAGIWNTLTDLVKGALNGVVTTLTAPVSAAISLAVGAVGLVSQVASYLGAWDLKVVVTPPGGPSPGQDRFAVGTETAHRNTLVVSASSLVDHVPPALRECADAFGSPLPTTLTPGSSVTWAVVANEQVVAFPAGLTAKVGQDGRATLPWTTGREQSAEGQLVTGRAFLRTTVHNPAASALANLAENLVQAAIARVVGHAAAPTVKGVLDGLARPVLDDIRSGAYDQSANVAFVITHHVCQASGNCTPSSTATTVPTPSTTTPPNGTVNCSAAPASLVGAVLGVPTGGPKQLYLGQSVVQCVYGTEIDKPALLRFYNRVNAASFAKLEALARAAGEPVNDLRFEDEAFSSESIDPKNGFTLYMLVARKGALIILMVSSAPVTAEERLAEQIFQST